jgi:hypothetical protein
MNEEEREKLERLLRSSLSGIEKKIIIEKLTGRVIKNGEELIKIEKESRLDGDGGIKTIDVFKISVFACGCKADGRRNFGGIDYKGNVVCNRHYYRCLRCRKPLSILTVKPINGIAYCERCSRIVKILRFFGLKK